MFDYGSTSKACLVCLSWLLLSSLLSSLLLFIIPISIIIVIIITIYCGFLVRQRRIFSIGPSPFWMRVASLSGWGGTWPRDVSQSPRWTSCWGNELGFCLNMVGKRQRPKISWLIWVEFQFSSFSHLETWNVAFYGCRSSVFRQSRLADWRTAGQDLAAPPWPGQVLQSLEKCSPNWWGLGLRTVNPPDRWAGHVDNPIGTGYTPERYRQSIFAVCILNHS